MQPQVRLSLRAQELLRCPICRAKLARTAQHYACTNTACNTAFPIVDGIPVLLNEQASLFSVDDFVSNRSTFFGAAPQNGLTRTIRDFLPALGKNIRGRGNYARLAELLIRQSGSQRILVVGGSILGQSMQSLAGNPSLELVETDVSFGPRTMLICDAHDIPFADGSFDAVIAQAVLEHVVDPHRCVAEIHRVLNAQGVVYAETPFMQQVHAGRYDFARFTHLGHRRLFRMFQEIDSGAVCGPGMALAWSYQYFLMSFTTSKTLRKLAGVFARLTSFFLKYFDYFLIDNQGALDAASGCYFMGRKADRALPDRELIKLYKGAG